MTRANPKRPSLTKERRSWLESLRRTEPTEVLVVTECGGESIDRASVKNGFDPVWLEHTRGRLSASGALVDAWRSPAAAWVEPLTDEARARVHHTARVEALRQRMQAYASYGGGVRLAHLSIDRLEQVHAIFDEADALASS